MQGEFDTAWSLATEARKLSSSTGYRILHLRALGLLGNLDMVEGRSDASWVDNSNGLASFWQGIYPDERAFQLYYNLEVDAERSDAVYLAIILQRETLNMIAGQFRFDFEAMAHFRMAQAADRAGDHETARNEILQYSDLIANLPASPAKNLYQAYCEIGLASLAWQNSSLQESREHLEKARSAVSTTGNVMLRLEYLKTAADVDRLSGDTSRERRHLEEITQIGANGFASLKSVLDRWRWQQVVGDTYRRLIEIKISSPHSPEHVFQFWQSYHELESASPLNKAATPSEMAASEKLILDRLERQSDSTLISYAVLPDSVVAWVVDDRRVREFTLPVEPVQLKREALEFYLLCSDPKSSLQKVNATGSRLYQWLIAPFERALDPKRTIRIAPDTFLSFIPWAALRVEDGTYLGVRNSIVIATGLNTGRREKVLNKPVRNVAIAVPNSLELNGETFVRPANVDDEVLTLKRLFPMAKVLSGNSVTVARILQELPDSYIFEFAGHAVTRAHGGELVVSGVHGPELISSATLAGLHLDRTRLAVLSACSTAAERDADRDPNGLVRALLNAGVRQVIATRWDVDSHSTEIMVRSFYDSFKHSQDATTSLRIARERVLTSFPLIHPYYWAATELFSTN